MSGASSSAGVCACLPPLSVEAAKRTCHHILCHLREELGEHALPGGHEGAQERLSLTPLPLLQLLRALLAKGARRLDAALQGAGGIRRQG